MSKLKTLKNKKVSGFTLLEILVMVIVVGFFAALIIPGLVNGPSRARDASRKNDLRTIKASLENYFNENGSYPTSLTQLEEGATPFIKKLPKDPQTKNDYIYVTNGEPPIAFVLEANLENKNDPDISKNVAESSQPNSYIIFSSN